MNANNKKKTVYDEYPNDKINGLHGSVKVERDKVKVVFSYGGDYTQGYDGCGTHTHAW